MSATLPSFSIAGRRSLFGRALNRLIIPSLRLFLLLFMLLLPAFVSATPSPMRFPKPEFDTGHQLPKATTPPARAVVLEYLDVVVLALALSLAAYYVIKKRSRRAVLALSIFSLFYFGFWRQGCICPVGSIQNVALAFFSTTYAIPVTALIIFLLPLLFTLFFGRVFCAAVCPLGMIQDVVHRKTVDVPHWLAAVLGLMPYAYLGLSMLLVSTGAGFIICQYDPFVGFFRLSAPQNMIIFGLVMLGIGLFVGRPYCRFLCPYGVLLNWLSRFSLKHATITPSECINCRLCEQSCPFGCIETTTPERGPVNRQTGRKRLGLAIAATPLLIAIGALAVSLMHVPLSRLHPSVRLAERMLIEQLGHDTTQTLETETFRRLGKDANQLYGRALYIRNQFKTGGAILGGFLGLVIGLHIIGLARRPYRTGYEIDRANCYSCARCFEFCPVELDRRGITGVKSILLGQFNDLTPVTMPPEKTESVPHPAQPKT